MNLKIKNETENKFRNAIDKVINTSVKLCIKMNTA